MRTGEVQVVAEHYPVVGDVLRLGTAQLHGEDRQAPPGQPAAQAVEDHPQGEVAEGAQARLSRLVEDDGGHPAAVFQTQ